MNAMHKYYVIVVDLCIQLAMACYSSQDKKKDKLAINTVCCVYWA